MDAIVVLTNLPDAGSAEQLAREMVALRLVACANILPAVRSIYHWQGKVEQADEVTVLFKTVRLHYKALEAAIVNAHPYEVPEVIALPVTDGLPAYLNWLSQETQG